MRPFIGMTVRTKMRFIEYDNIIPEGSVATIVVLHLGDRNPYYHYVSVRFAPEICSSNYGVYLRHLQFKKS